MTAAAMLMVRPSSDGNVDNFVPVYRSGFIVRWSLPVLDQDKVLSIQPAKPSKSLRKFSRAGEVFHRFGSHVQAFVYTQGKQYASNLTALLTQVTETKRDDESTPPSPEEEAQQEFKLLAPVKKSSR